jgi:PAS domain S-box-containing protein
MITRFLLDLPLRRKLRLLIMATSSVALVLAAAGFIAHEWFALREEAKRGFGNEAQWLAQRLAPFAYFNERERAQNVLETLRARPQIAAARLFREPDEQSLDEIVASYLRAGSAGSLPREAPAAHSVRVVGGHLVIAEPLARDGEKAGTLYLCADVPPLQRRFWQAVVLVSGVLVVCWLISLWLAQGLQKVVSQPILDLLQTARRVSDQKDYGLRAVKRSQDELGQLIDGFNDMLAQIQTRDTAVQRAYDDLERRVTERTQELREEVMERRRIEAALADEKERLAVTLRSIGDAVVATDRRGHILVFNAAAEQLTGCLAAQVLGRPLSEVLCLLNAETRQAGPDLVARALESQSTVQWTEHTLLIAVDGTERLIATSTAPIRDAHGAALGVVFAFRDITDQERTTQELLKASKLESLGLLAGGIAHDFNNTLTVILGNISLARLFAPSQGELASALLAAEKASLRAGELTQQLLTFAKGGVPVKQTASLPEILRETTAFVLHGSKVACHLELPGDLWPAEIDVGQISRVLHNLVFNALQAMPAGGSLQVRAENVPPEAAAALGLRPDRYLAIAVQDSGSGIAPEHLPRIFDPYFTTKREGSGLGLATALSIVRKHDGDLRIKSTLGQGTICDLYLPAGRSTPTERPAPNVLPLAGRGRILVMDDEAPIRQFVEASLKRLGYDAEAVADGAEAVRRYREAMMSGQPFTAVILDLTVPGGMGGNEAIRELRALDPDVKAIVSSGYSADPVMANHREHGFRAVVAKPYRLEQLARSLQDITRGS